ncbi:hypothetical protein G9298_29115 (plasmid) [Bacillus thuringiensis]|nr:hypothetical protein G9298_29115 [Bacillus thuringiensis]
MENKSKSFVVTVTPIEESSSLTIQSDQTNPKKEIQTPGGSVAKFHNR